MKRMKRVRKIVLRSAPSSLLVNGHQGFKDIIQSLHGSDLLQLLIPRS